MFDDYGTGISQYNQLPELSKQFEASKLGQVVDEFVREEDMIEPERLNLREPEDTFVVVEATRPPTLAKNNVQALSARNAVPSFGSEEISLPFSATDLPISISKEQFGKENPTDGDSEKNGVSTSNVERLESRKDDVLRKVTDSPEVLGAIPDKDKEEVDSMETKIGYKQKLLLHTMLARTSQ